MTWFAKDHFRMKLCKLSFQKWQKAYLYWIEFPIKILQNAKLTCHKIYFSDWIWNTPWKTKHIPSLPHPKHNLRDLLDKPNWDVKSFSHTTKRFLQYMLPIICYSFAHFKVLPPPFHVHVHQLSHHFTIFEILNHQISN